MRRAAQRCAAAGATLAALAVTRAVAGSGGIRAGADCPLPAKGEVVLRAVGTFGAAAALLWLLRWGASIAPLPIPG